MEFSRNKKRNIFLCLLIAGIFILFYYLVNPESNFSFKCPFHFFTGYKCVGCGLQRAIHATMHGNICEAVSYNPALAVVVPLLILYFLSYLTKERYSKLYAFLNSYTFIGVLVALTLFWWVYRNIIDM